MITTDILWVILPRPLWATVRVTGNAFYLNCDVWGTLWPVNTDIGWYDAVDGQRVITVFNPLWDDYAGYDHAVKLLRLQNVFDERGGDADSRNRRGIR